MKYRVTHTTEYYYDEPVPLCHNVIRLRPRDTGRQVCHRSTLAISPAPAARRERVDFFGNHATWVSLQEPHDVLKVEAVSEVEVEPESGEPQGGRGPARSWEQVRDLLAAVGSPRDGSGGDGGGGGAEPDSYAGLYAVKEFTFDSPHVRADPQLAQFAKPSFPPGRPLLECVWELTQRIYREFTFDPRSTTIGTPILEVLRNRRGVCQDFAHLEIGCLRSLGLAARYVSGYLLTHPPPGQKRLVGCDASHAWLSAYVPGAGWVDFDPTNGVIPSTEHIILGWARDYDDVSPIRGVLVGGHRHSMYFGVGVEPLDPPPDASDAPEESGNGSGNGSTNGRTSGSGEKESRMEGGRDGKEPREAKEEKEVKEVKEVKGEGDPPAVRDARNGGKKDGKADPAPRVTPG